MSQPTTLPDIWFISDTHFDHNNIIKFTGLDGNLIRPGFSSIEEMNEHIIQKWNSVVMPDHKVYHLGDFGKLEFAKRLNGHKRLILGNHDTNFKGLIGPFGKVMAARTFKEEGIRFILTHYPIDFECDNVPGKTPISFNVHGHIHEKLVMKGNQPDKRYINLSVEQINYTPIHIQELIKEMKKRLSY